MMRKYFAASDAGAEPQLAAGERGHGGACAGAVVERGGARGGPGRLPDVLVGRLVEAAPARRRGVRAGGQHAAARAGGDCADELRSSCRQRP